MKLKLFTSIFLIVVTAMFAIETVGTSASSVKKEVGKKGSAVVADAGQKSAPLARTPIICAIGEWIPFTSETLTSYGMFTEMVTEIFHQAGYEPSFHFYPWKRAELIVESGEAFCSFPYVQTAERSVRFNFSQPIMLSNERFFYMKKRFPNGFNFKTIEELKPYSIGGSIGYWYEEEYRNAKLNVSYVPTDDMNFEKLRTNRIDLFSCNEEVGRAIIAKLYPNKMSEFATTIKTRDASELRLLISRKYPNSLQIQSDFDAALLICLKNGTVEKIRRKWIQK